jgi:hypothetical protein
MVRQDNVKLAQIQDLIRRHQYKLTEHANEPLRDGELDRNDIECSIQNGVISKIQKDEMKQAYDGKKYTITGPTYSGLPISTVGKIVRDEDGEDYILITAYINL